MKFFDRKREIKKLREIRELSHNVAQFTVVTGRRRIGKTSLMLKAYADEPVLYFFVSRKAESELCVDFANEIEEKRPSRYSPWMTFTLTTQNIM